MRPEFVFLLAIGVIGALSMPVYAAGRAKRGKDKLEVADRGSFVFGTFVRDWFYWFLRPIEAPALAIGLGPLFFNVGGAVMGALAGVAFAADHFVWGGWGVLLGGIADILDGRIARAKGVASARGAFLDSTLDRFAEVGAFMGLAVRFGDSPWAVLMVAGALGGSLLVSYARARGESVGVVCKLGVMQRAERLIILGLAGILDPSASDLWPSTAWGDPAGALLVPALTVIAVGTLGTAVFRTAWIAKRLSGAPDPKR
ncbi:MAG: CDP-alcohol phosphatidyltransferase family protein [Gemmatimonadetes bacterium]|nr:CDP-alcohol phosphatidyltransferase family protein [Gemmatimonadota bacterium]